MPTIDTLHGTLWFADHRHPDATTPVMVLVHGAGGSHLDWSIGLRRLNSIAVDLPGHGKSPKPGRESIADYSEVVVALLDALDLPHAVIAGHSMGGGIAQTVALTHPDRVSGLVLVGTGAKLRVSPLILDRIQHDQAAVGELLKEWMWGSGVDDQLREQGYTQFMKADPAVVYGDYKACDVFDVRGTLNGITQPTLVIGGTDDRLTPFKFSEYLAEHIPHAQLVTVEGGGHMMALEQPEVVTEAVRAWITSRTIE